MTIEQIRKLVANKLDIVLESASGGVGVSFYATEGMSQGRLVVHLRVMDGYVQVDSSTCLPTNGWVAVAEAYARAASFLRRSGLNDRRFPVKEGGE